MKRVIIVSIWFILTMAVFTWTCSMLTKPSTVANIVGAIVVVLYLLLSIETKCFTSINLINKK